MNGFTFYLLLKRKKKKIKIKERTGIDAQRT